jgi:hypothetical protein
VFFLGKFYRISVSLGPAFMPFYDNAGEIKLFISGGGGDKAHFTPPPPERVQHFGSICNMDLELFFGETKVSLTWGKKLFSCEKTKITKIFGFEI